MSLSFDCSRDDSDCRASLVEVVREKRSNDNFSFSLEGLLIETQIRENLDTQLEDCQC